MKTRFHPWVVAAMPALFMLAFSCTSCAQGTVRIFLKLDGVSGESTFDGHRGKIDVLSCGFDSGSGIENLLSTTDLRPGITPLRIAKRLDKASPQLFLRSLVDSSSTSATVSFRNTTQSFDFLVITLQNVRVNDYSLNGDQFNVPTESIELSYKQITVRYTQPARSDFRRGGTSFEQRFTLQ